MANDDLKNDLLRGAAALAAYTGWTLGQTYYLCESGQIPATKVGGKWLTRKSTITAYLDRRLAESMPSA